MATQMVSDDKAAQTLQSGVLMLPGWEEFNRRKWGVDAQRLTWVKAGKELPRLEALFYTDRRGRVKQPPLNPYLALDFHVTPTQFAHKRTGQWLDVADQLAEELLARGVANRLVLSPDVVDVRALQWAGLHVGVRYTYRLALPYQIDAADGMVRNRMSRASKQGVICERTRNMYDVHRCLLGTEARQQFDHQLTVSDMELLMELLGEEAMRTYVAYGSDGEPASAQIVLHHPGAPALGWVVGTTREALKSGAGQQLIGFMLDDLARAGASEFDFVGANIRSVAQMKADWGATLLPSYTVEAHGWRLAARMIRDWWRYERMRRRGDRTS